SAAARRGELFPRSLLATLAETSCLEPLSLSLPHKGGGNPVARAFAIYELCRGPPHRGRHRAHGIGWGARRRLLPPPLWGRDGEGGSNMTPYYRGVSPAALMMRSHFTASACTKAENSSAVMLIGSMWTSVSRLAATGSATSSRAQRLSLSTMAFGVPCGANRANQVDIS